MVQFHMIKYLDIITRFTKKSTTQRASKADELHRVGYGYMKRRLGLLSNEANALIEAQRASNTTKNR